MAPIKVAGWSYRDGKWSKGTYVVTRDRSGLKAWMPIRGRLVPIGTSNSGDVPAFLNRVDSFIDLKDTVYA